MDAATTDEATKLLEDLDGILPSRGRVLIIPHDFPDPDALASAAALHLLLLKRWKIRSQIVFTGLVSRAENRELLRHFKYSWKPTGQYRHQRRALPALMIDTVPGRGNVTIPPFAKPIGIFDHHPCARRPWPEGMLADINPSFGAEATRFLEILQVAQISIPKWLAALMAYAIVTETVDFTRHSSGRDIAAYTDLVANCNLKILGQIRNAPVPRDYYRYLVEAVHNARTHGRVSWTHLPQVSQPAIVAEIADLLLRMERITWSFCTAFSADDRLIVSLRSELTHVNCGRLLRSLIRPKEGSAGGHSQSAAGFLDVANLTPEQRTSRRDTLVLGLVNRIAGRTATAATPLLEPVTTT